MRRFGIALIAAFALLVAVAPAAYAIGPGGWDHVGQGSTATAASLNGNVTALNTDNPGVLYVGGNFVNAGGRANADRIAKWNGASWSAIGNVPLTNGSVFAIAYHAGKVYVGGTFQDAGGDPKADFLAAWNGTAWEKPCTSTTLAKPITSNVNALQVIGHTLYVGGSFANGAGIDAADYLVACNLNTGGTASAVVDTAVHAFGGAIAALTADGNGTLYAGGGFINLESIPEADHVAEYTGSGLWQAMGSGTGAGGAAVDTFVRSLAAHGTDVYVGTDAADVAGIAQADRVARWDGGAWHAVGADSAGTNGWFSTGFTIDALATYGSLVIAAGSFQNADGIATADDIAYFDGSHWRPIGSNGAGNGPLSAHPVSLGIVGGKVYVGGSFTSAGGDSMAKYLAAYGLRQPDAMIGASTAGSFVGNNVYSPTGAGEVRHVTVNRGHSTAAYIKIQNDGLVTASFTINGTGGASGYAVHYFRGTTNVTSAVRGGTYVTDSIDARGSFLIRMVVTLAKSTASSATFVTTARSQNGTHDGVRFAVTAG
jgi:hypothetical protein